MIDPSWRSAGMRWLKFNLVGAIGIAVQLLILVLLKAGLGLDYLWATALAVEGAVAHNFLWHERFTWPKRREGGSWARFVKFNLTSGVLSIAGNLGCMKVLAGLGHLNYRLANGITIAACSLLNFLISDRLVFAEIAARNQSM